MSVNTSSRIEYIDTAKGICIALVVFFHAKGILHCNYYLDSFLTSFRMPLYFFLSGLFFKDYGSFTRFITKKTNKLLVPFVFFYITFSVILPNILHTFFGKNFDTVIGWPSLWAFIYPGVYPNIPIWFLWCLFLMNIFFWQIRHLIISLFYKYERIILTVICFIFGAIGYQLIDSGFFDYGRVLTVLLDIPFFCIGYLFKAGKGLQYLQKMSPNTTWSLALLLAILTLSITILFVNDNSFVYYSCGIMGTIFILLLAKYFGQISFVSYLGRYSIIVLVTHEVIISITSSCYTYIAILTDSTHVSTFFMFFITLLFYYIIIPLMCRYLPYVTAQKSLLPE